MSSNAYFAELRPDPALRRVVQWSAAALGLAGAAVLMALEAPLWLRLVGGAVWCAGIALKIRKLRMGWSECVAFRVHADGSLAVLGPDGEWRPGRLEADGVLLRRWGWLRLRAVRGTPFAEPVRGSCRLSRDWRRLHVLWRHVGAGE